MHRLSIVAAAATGALILGSASAEAPGEAAFRSIAVEGRSETLSAQPFKAYVRPIAVAEGFTAEQMRIGDEIEFAIEGVEDASIYILNMAADGEIRMIFPNGFDEENYIEDTEAVVVPRPGSAYSFRVTGEPGFEVVKILAVRGDYSPLEDMLYEYFDKQEQFPKANFPSEDVARAINGFLVGEGETQYVEATLEYDIVE